MRPKLPPALRSLADAILSKTGKPGRPDTATRMAMDADFSRTNDHRHSAGLIREPMRAVDVLEELERLTKRPPQAPPTC
jgi:hypothetical protein